MKECRGTGVGPNFLDRSALHLKVCSGIQLRCLYIHGPEVSDNI